jgi:hypothetical protein
MGYCTALVIKIMFVPYGVGVGFLIPADGEGNILRNVVYLECFILEF